MSERIRRLFFFEYTPPLRLILGIFFSIFSFALHAAETDFRVRESALNRQISNIDDIRAEVEVGRNIAAKLLARFKLDDDKNRTRYVNLVGQSLVLYSSRSELEFHFAVIDDPAENAYSTPGGYVFITTGAINALSNESELAAILAHEIAHVSEKHIVREFDIHGEDKSSISGLSRIIGGSQESTRVAFAQAVDKALEMLLDKGFKQNDERDADRVAILLLAQTGYDVNALTRVLEKTQQKTKKDVASKTHPATSERLRLLSEYLQSEKMNELNLAKGESRFKEYVKR